MQLQKETRMRMRLHGDSTPPKFAVDMSPKRSDHEKDIGQAYDGKHKMIPQIIY
jgi:hypothetical protein